MVENKKLYLINLNRKEYIELTFLPKISSLAVLYWLIADIKDAEEYKTPGTWKNNKIVILAQENNTLLIQYTVFYSSQKKEIIVGDYSEEHWQLLKHIKYYKNITNQTLEEIKKYIKRKGLPLDTLSPLKVPGFQDINLWPGKDNKYYATSGVFVNLEYLEKIFPPKTSKQPT